MGAAGNPLAARSCEFAGSDIVRGHTTAPLLYIAEHGCKLIRAADSASHCMRHSSQHQLEAGLSEKGDVIFEMDTFDYQDFGGDGYSGRVELRCGESTAIGGKPNPNSDSERAYKDN
jgi:hypothetical protein